MLKLIFLSTSIFLLTPYQSYNNQNSKAKKKTTVKSSIIHSNFLAVVLGPLEVVAGQENQWSAVFSSSNETAVGYTWYRRVQGQTYWETVGNELHYIDALETNEPYSTIYELKVDVLTDNNQVYTSSIHTVEAYYDPGWTGCNYVGGPNC